MLEEQGNDIFGGETLS